MLRKVLCICLLFVPLFAHAATSAEISKYLIGKWQVESIKKENSTEYHPPKRPMKWEFTKNGILIEELGASGAKVKWHYHVDEDEIKTQLGSMAFSWKVLSMQPKLMLIKHQLGVLKVKRM